MIEGLKPYAEAKLKPMVRTSAINIPWLTVMPTHWQVVRAKGLFTARTERARPDDEQLSATQAYGVIPQKEFERRVGRKVVQITQHLDKRAHVEPDDFVISMRSFQGGLERAWARGCIRSSYVVLKPSPQTEVGYFSHLFKSLDYIRALQATGNFIRDGQDLNFNNFSLVDLPLPPPDEQADIAKCLDHANRKIDVFIRAKRKLIGLLNEQKQAIIHRAVTRGLDPDVHLKPSGIPWLGDIPQHWEVRRAKYLFREIDDRSKDGKETHLAMSQRLGLVPSNMVESAMRSESYAGAKLCQEGDLVLNRLKAHLGVFALAKQGGVISPDYSVFRKRATISMEYYESVLKSSACRRELRVRAKGLVEGFWRLYTDDFYDIRLPVPPFEEQKEIMSAMTIETAALTTAIARTEREIALMQEYRTRLTADLVTGKLDVREAAAKLPEPPAEPAAEEVLEDFADECEPDENPLP
jgi:type I restriction enzyme S subunit